MAKSYPLTKQQVKPRYYPYTVVRNTATQHLTSGGFFKLTATDYVTLGVSPSNWRDAISRGGSATSSLEGITYQVKEYNGFATETFLADPRINNLGIGTPNTLQTSLPGPATAPDDSADAQARTALLNSYIRARNKWRGANFLAEVRETIHMLRHPLQSLFGHTFSFANALRKIRHLKPKAYRRALGRLWLAFSFGWKPLFEDIKDANSAIRALSETQRADYLRISGAGAYSGQLSNVVGLTSMFPLMSNNLQEMKMSWYTNEVKYYGAVRARPENLSTVRESFGLDGYDIIPAIWEAVPWSFFIDYFANVQEVLDGMRYAGADLSWLNVAVRNKRFYFSRWLGSTTSSWNITHDVGPRVYIGTYKQRGSRSTLPYPKFRFKIPGLGSNKWLNIGALVAAFESSRPRYRSVS